METQNKEKFQQFCLLFSKKIYSHRSRLTFPLIFVIAFHSQLCVYFPKEFFMLIQATFEESQKFPHILIILLIANFLRNLLWKHFKISLTFTKKKKTEFSLKNSQKILNSDKNYHLPSSPHNTCRNSKKKILLSEQNSQNSFLWRSANSN